MGYNKQKALYGLLNRSDSNARGVYQFEQYVTSWDTLMRFQFCSVNIFHRLLRHTASLQLMWPSLSFTSCSWSIPDFLASIFAIIISSFNFLVLVFQTVDSLHYMKATISFEAADSFPLFLVINYQFDIMKLVIFWKQASQINPTCFRVVQSWFLF